MKNNDNINHPDHYLAHPSGVECIEITEGFSFNIGNIIKYLWRADEKGAPIDDLQKAQWYLTREITRRINAANTAPLVAKPAETIPVESPRFLDYADAKEQVEIGKDYYHGTNNRKQDFEVAVEWWTLAAAQGNAEAQWLLGNAYLFGRGVEKNKDEANRLWKLSQQNRFGKDAQNPIPQTYTAPLVTKSDSSPTEKIGNTLAYAQSGDANRQYEMGNMCYTGEGMPQDKDQAVEWWMLAAEQGHSGAQIALDIYEVPAPVTRQTEENGASLADIRLQAVGGDRQAQLYLAQGYAHGWYGLIRSSYMSCLWRSRANEPRTEEDAQ